MNKVSNLKSFNSIIFLKTSNHFVYYLLIQWISITFASNGGKSCPQPSVPLNSHVVLSDELNLSYGSTATYKCDDGYQLFGPSVRTCSNGNWTNGPPFCAYGKLTNQSSGGESDCGLPFPISHAKWLLTTNTTHYRSTVEYVCDPNFKIKGSGTRICLENGTWSGTPPICDVLTCNKPETKDDKTIVEANSYSVAAKASYSCNHGSELVGDETRTCDSSGHWSGNIPYCRLVDCGRPPVVKYARGYLMNGDTLFGSVVEYHCLPDFKMIGGFQRKCLANKNWSGTTPQCLELDIANEIENRIKGQSDKHDSKVTRPIY